MEVPSDIPYITAAYVFIFICFYLINFRVSYWLEFTAMPSNRLNTANIVVFLGIIRFMRNKKVRHDLQRIFTQERLITLLRDLLMNFKTLEQSCNQNQTMIMFMRFAKVFHMLKKKRYK